MQKYLSGREIRETALVVDCCFCLNGLMEAGQSWHTSNATSLMDSDIGWLRGGKDFRLTSRSCEAYETHHHHLWAESLFQLQSFTSDEICLSRLSMAYLAITVTASLGKPVLSNSIHIPHRDGDIPSPSRTSIPRPTFQINGRLLTRNNA